LANSALVPLPYERLCGTDRGELDKDSSLTTKKIPTSGVEWYSPSDVAILTVIRVDASFSSLSVAIIGNLTSPVRTSIDQEQSPTLSEGINRKPPPFLSSFEVRYRAPLTDLEDIRRQAFFGFPFVDVFFSGVLG